MPKPTAPLDVQTVRDRLARTRFADVRYLPQTRSTNADAQLLLGDPASFGATIVADYQIAGAGRKGRRWFAPPGAALLFTAILPRPVATTALWAVPFWIALGIARGIERSCGVALELVWPNDLHVRGGKVAGILSVARIAGDDAWVGCGIGINVFRPAADAELDALDPAPVFLDDLAAGINREAVLTEILLAFDATLAALDDADRVALRWEERAHLAGTLYRYRRDSDGIECDAVAQRIGAHGSLVVRDAGGETSIDMADVRVIGRGAATLPAQE